MKVFILEGIYFNADRTEDSKAILGVFYKKEDADNAMQKLIKTNRTDINLGYIEYDVQGYDVQ